MGYTACMQVNPVNLAALATTPAVAAQTLRLVAGDISSIQTSIVAATVGRIQNGQAELKFGNTIVLVRDTVNLKTGDAITLRVTGGKTNPQLEIIPQAVTPAAVPSTTPVAPRTPGNAAQVSVVEVLSRESTGQVLVKVEGEELKATSQEPLQSGGRYVALVQRTPEGVVLRPVPETPDLPRLVAAAILRIQQPSPLAEAVPPLLTELESVPPAVLGQKISSQQRAVAEIRSALTSVTPKALEALPQSAAVRDASAPVAAVIPSAIPEVRALVATLTAKVLVGGSTPELQQSITAFIREFPTLAATPEVRELLRTFPAPVPVTSGSPAATPEVRELVSALAAKVLEGTSTAELQKTIAEFVQKFPSSADAPEVRELLQTISDPESIPSKSTRDVEVGPRRSLGGLTHPARAAETHAPPTAGQIRAAVEDGGQHYEAKLGREASGETRATADRTPDLKGGLLRLFQSLPTLAHAQFPVAQRTLESIEAQQAQNVFAQETGGAYVYQVPYIDGGRWQTLNLALEPEYETDEQGEKQPKAFRMMMQVPLSDLGETWIEAGLHDDRLFAVVYVQSQAVLDRLTPELPALKAELLGGGFREALLDVRPLADWPERVKKRATIRPESGSIVDARA